MLVAFVLAGAIRWTLGSRIGVRLAASGIGIAMLLALVIILGDPVWPPRTGMQKLPYLFAVFLAAGLVVDTGRPRPLAQIGAGVVGIGVSALWLGWPRILAGDFGAALAILGAVLIGLGAFTALLRAGCQGVNGPSMLVLAAAGLAGAGFNAGSLALFQVALALAAAVGGFALWSWPRPRLLFSASGLLTAGLGAFALALLILLLTEIRPWALLPLALVFAGELVARRLPVPGRFSREAIEPLYIAALAIVPVAAAVWLAQPPIAPDSPYYP
jgi:hypothetical protein